jgi:hypothetical protein
MDHARKGGTVVCPKAGIGTGLSELPARAPRLMDHMLALAGQVPAGRPPRLRPGGRRISVVSP